MSALSVLPLSHSSIPRDTILENSSLTIAHKILWITFNLFSVIKNSLKFKLTSYVLFNGR
jgi:hypothetical protein